MKNFFVRCFLEWPDSFASHFSWLAPLFGRLVVGWIFLWRGWDDLHNLHTVTSDFRLWGIPDPKHLAPVIAGVEFAGGLFLLAGFLSRFSAIILVALMILLLSTTHWSLVHSGNLVQALSKFVSYGETQYLALFLWLAVAGAGPVSVDSWLQKKKA